MMTKKNLTLMVAGAIITIALIMLLINLRSLREGKEEQIEFKSNMSFTVTAIEKQMKKDEEMIKQSNKKVKNKNIITEINKKEVSTETYIEEQPKRPHINNIPLSEEILDYTYKLANESGISYELVLAIMKTESEFNEDVVSATKDYGLLQINQSNIKSFAKAAGVRNVDPLDSKDNIAMGVYYLSYLREKYLELGFSEEDTYFLTILAYNRGEGAALKYVKNHGWSNSYVIKVSNNKQWIEENIEA
ncbi:MULTISPECIES: lytic transglycosylase domain-containing protein [unclassified Paenibacillus]|uniref:lytic transglycosylase domain-containing protein n=1 Tax=unclassified Paenibacillus TaxID=185978 RepID=UPI0036D2E80E